MGKYNVIIRLSSGVSWRGLYGILDIKFVILFWMMGALHGCRKLNVTPVTTFVHPFILYL